MIAPNYRPGQSCASCEHGILINHANTLGFTEPTTKCSKYGLVFPGGVCDDWEED